MRRLAAVLGVLAALAAVVAVVSAPATGADTYRVDAVFDTAKGVIPGQLVKIAGARVGEIADVRLTEDYRARIVMEVPRRFSFRRDASCTIQPEGLISENFVQCDPGRPSAPALEGDPPTVPVERTTVPVSLTDLFRIFQADVRQRFTVAVAAVGGGLAARGDDLNDVIRRANPTLAAVRSLTRDLAAQRAELSRAVADTDRVLASLARRRGAVGAFIESTDDVTARLAARRGELAETIRRLPPLLDATDAAIAELDRLATRGRPLLGQLRAAAPGLEALLGEVRPFAGAARPALRRLAATAQRARPVIRHARPVVGLLAPFARAARPTGAGLARTLVDLRDRGFVEGLNLFAYYGAAAQARYDAVSHIFPNLPVFSSCSPYAEEPVAGCNAFFDRRARAAATADERDRPRARDRDRRRPPRRSDPVPAPRAPEDRPERDRLPVPEVLKPLADQVLDDQLEGELPEQLEDALGDGGADAQALQDLTDFLLGS